ncbi:2-dehydropantoate 2-reductase [Paraburkholderia sp. Ac-20336]|uniref:2-dehydropantoate 2-reductase n=1 Tax=Burkholderiaceae TaxID=119060 RepID=UPI001424281B|nr:MULTISPECIES: 2-dehydropantoate 2-reductase [Burkholderiaceae]MBN3807282.1 2-dehydropantoate 2-reductase [Paraburkholderia sp. Ac-20336]NIF52970.1 2-dehydropantoate 2-reductase [Burkholderia sp. Ax-1724]NIF76316.1 2-dehydropantoate 2-reductase [Paraburkholderia sp. Cy-641]
MKVAIYGAGAIGGWMGVKLAQAGHAVSVVARGATLDALRQHGLRLVEGGVVFAEQVEASENPASLGVQELVVIAVKGPAMAAVAARIAPLLGPGTIVLTAMNGVPWWFCDGLGGGFARQRLTSIDPDGAIAAAIPGARTVGCVVHASCLVDAPGVIRHHQGNGLIVGEASGQPSERVEQLAALLRAAGFDASMSAQIQRDVWYKLWGNMTMNPVSALTGATTDRILGDELVRGFVTQIMLEAKEIGARFGIPIEQAPDDRHAITLKLGAMKTSMLQDVQAGKAVELDALVGAVRELGQLTQVPTPYTDVLLGLARLQASTLGLYPKQ